MGCCGRRGVIFCSGSERSWSIHPPPRVGPGRVREAEGGGALSRRRHVLSTARRAVLAPPPPPASQAINNPSIIKQTLTWRPAARDPGLASQQRPAPPQPSSRPDWGPWGSCRDRDLPTPHPLAMALAAQGEGTEAVGPPGCASRWRTSRPRAGGWGRGGRGGQG